METDEKPRVRGLTRATIVARALEIGESEGLDAVSLRRVASELGVTPMALYRHFHDKQDLVNAMAEAVLEDLDVSAGLDPAMPWTDRLSRAARNFKEQMDARPLAMPLSIAYTGEGTASFWRMSDTLLGILLEAGFERRQAIVLMRVLSNLLAGYLWLMRQDEPADYQHLDARQLDLLRRRVELAQLSLPAEEYPNLVESAADMAEVWVSDPDRWWRETVDLLTRGLEGMLDASRARDRRDTAG